MYRVLFVCTGNVCRSVLAVHALRHELAAAGIVAEVGSAGLRTEIAGTAADAGTQALLASHGYPVEHAVCQFEPRMFTEYDLIVALDGNHHWVLRQLAPDAAAVAKVRLLGSFDPAAGAGWDVPDPVGGSVSDYERTFGLIKSALPGVLASVRDSQRAAET